MAAATAFHDLADFVALPRLAGLALSPDGDRLVTGVAELSADGTRWVTALWEVDPAGERDAVRLTRSEQGESAPAFLPDGSLLFLSKRPAPGPADQQKRDSRDQPETALWRLPARGEAERLVSRAGGIAEFAVAERSGRVAFAASLLPGAQGAEDDEELRRARKEAKVSAVLYESGPVRYWDHDIGPGVPRVYVADPADGGGRPVDAGVRGDTAEGIALSPDGSLVAFTAFAGPVEHDRSLTVVVADAATGRRRAVLESGEHHFYQPAFTPDGRSVVCLRSTRSTRKASGDTTLWRLDLDAPAGEGPGGRDLAPGFDQWPLTAVVARTGAVFFTADERGHRPVFRLDPDGSITRLTASGAYDALAVSPDGATVYALRDSLDAPPGPVRLRADAADQEPVPLRAPGGAVPLPGTLTEVHATADDGAGLRAWLALPDGADAGRPAPLLVFVHGGPQTSWNSWHWRWSPWPAVARGYAVVLPDPALSTGYGQHNHARGWAGWGQQPYRDVLALADAATARPEIDGGRSGLLGGSYGGYLANWTAGHTDRFRAIVAHAGLWNLHAFAGGSDTPSAFARIFGDPLEEPERFDENSPHLHASRITTPMLLVHGAKDYRVPVGEAMSLWHELQRHQVPAKYLYFPDENHWVLTPGNARIWYTTVLNFLDHHVLDKPWVRPDLL